MKRNICITIIFLLSKLINGQPVDESIATIVARNFFASKYNKSMSEILIKNTITIEYGGHNSYFINNFEGGGWVIVSAHKARGPVLAYSDKNTIIVQDAPNVFWDWMRQYEALIDFAYKNNWFNEEKNREWGILMDTIVNSKLSNLKSHKSFTPPFYLLSTEWGQSISNDIYPYCPAYNALADINNECYCDRCSAGCNSVALAQIMNYWSYSHGQNADFNWWDMPNSLIHYENQNYETEKDAVAYLLYRCHIENESVYCDKGCGTPGHISDDKNAFIGYDYDDQTIDIKRKIFFTYQGWVDMLKDELNNGRPVEYRAIDQETGKGHAFVCDGHDGDNTFHFNLGWNGHCNGWYDFEDLECIEYNCDFTNVINHKCIAGIKPDAPTSRTLQNIIIGSGQNNTFHAISNISAAGNDKYFIINNNAKCRFVAEDYIELQPGFHAESGSSFLAKLYPESKLKSGTFYNNSKNTDILNSIDDKENQNLNNFTIYPNPTSGVLYLNTTNKEASFRIEIYNITGKQVYQNRFDHANNIEINTSKLKNGIYILKVYYYDSISNYKIIKN